MSLPKKVCLVFQRRFTRVAHMIALDLRARHGIGDFCGYVYMNSSARFLRDQKDIAYGRLLVDEELYEASARETLDWDYLNKLEKEYGLPSLWPYIVVDRIIRYGMGVREYPYNKTSHTHEEMARMLQTTARAIIDFLDEEKPDVIFLPAVSALGNMLLFHIAQKKGITVLAGAETRIDGGYILSESYRTFSFADARFHTLMQGAKSPREKDAQAYLEQYRAKPRTYRFAMESFKDSGGRREAFSWLMPQKIVRSVRWLSERIVRTTMEPAHDYMEQSPWWFLLDALQRKFRLMRGYGDLYDKYDVHESFAYYPLHLEPEMAMLLLARQWTDQINLIKQIAEALPLSYKLYVKEHPGMVGFRSRRYYKELKKIPNVKLIHPNHDSHAIIKDAKLVLTQTGTAGWEAILLKKPIITFGNVYYNSLPMVEKVSDLSRLPAAVFEQLEHPKHDEKALVNFVAALLEDSADIDMHELWEHGLHQEKESASIRQFTNLLISKSA